MATLSEHLVATGLTQAEFANLVGLNQATVSKICRGRVGVSLRKAIEIHNATNGQVPVQSLVSPSDAPLTGASQ